MIQRRALLSGTIASAALAVPALGQPRGSLQPKERPMSFVLPNTRYFEVDSARAAARYAIWVTVPPPDRGRDQALPVVYLPDGNGAAPRFIPIHAQLGLDVISPTRPFIQVCVGYPPDQAPRELAIRARDLLPPHEALPDGMIAAMRSEPNAEGLDREGTELYIRNLENPAGDRFLAFLVEELHPQLKAMFPIDDSQGAGLFGYSYGGLFALYATLSHTGLFRMVGAGSPGVLARRSRIFELYQQTLRSKADYSGRRLHVTLNERELTFPSYYQPMVGVGTAEFLALAGQQPLPGLRLTSGIIAGESHISGFGPAYMSFLRTCYALDAAG